MDGDDVVDQERCSWKWAVARARQDRNGQTCRSDPRVPAHRRMLSEGRPTLEDIASEIRREREEPRAVEPVVTWATEAGYERLWATVRAWNVASRRVLEKLGFHETGQIDADDGEQPAARPPDLPHERRGGPHCEVSGYG